MAKNKKLTPKQLSFCREYLANGGNATKAALAAGYKPKAAYSTGSENLRKPEIREYLEEFSTRNAEKFEYSLSEHVRDLDELAGLARSAGDYRTALRARELKGKVCGHYIERKEEKHDVCLSVSWEGDGGAGQTGRAKPGRDSR